MRVCPTKIPAASPTNPHSQGRCQDDTKVLLAHYISAVQPRAQIFMHCMAILRPAVLQGTSRSCSKP